MHRNNNESYGYTYNITKVEPFSETLFDGNFVCFTIHYIELQLNYTLKILPYK